MACRLLRMNGNESRKKGNRNESIYSWLGSYPGRASSGFGTVGSTDLGI